MVLLLDGNINLIRDGKLDGKLNLIREQSQIGFFLPKKAYFTSGMHSELLSNITMITMINTLV